MVCTALNFRHAFVSIRRKKLRRLELLDEGGGAPGKIVLKKALHFRSPVIVALIKFIGRLLVTERINMTKGWGSPRTS
jgi:hypothetical protein